MRRPSRAAGFLTLALAIGGPVGPALGTTVACLRGINLAGAEFGALPGRRGTDYAYPSAATIRAFAGMGMTVIRLPFRWERLQPAPKGEFDAGELAALDATVGTATQAGLTVVLDPHNYAHYRDARLGTEAAPAELLADLWSRLAKRFGGRQRVAFGLMNEPYDVPAGQWVDLANTAIAAIRATGSKALILVPGTAYTGLHSWTDTLAVGNNGTAMAGLHDPAGNLAIEVHQYLDADHSGRNPECSAAGELDAAFTRFEIWLSDHRLRGFLGEFGASDRPECLEALRGVLARLDQNPDRWLGWTYWAAGDWWAPDYMFTAQPGPRGDRPQTVVLRTALPKPGARPPRCAGPTG